MTWAHIGSGKFSVGSCYNLIIKDRGIIHDNDTNWDWIWKIKIPMRIITFIWILLQNKILSNQNCVIRNISSNPYCKSCGRLESTRHIFKDCSNASQVWHLLGNFISPHTGSISFNLWLEKNLKDKRLSHPNRTPCQTIFACTLLQIWKARNSLQFENMQFDANQVAFKSIELTTETFNAFKNNALNNLRITKNRLIKWSPPPTSRIKINTDGSSVDHGWASFGGLAHDENGKWLEGFCGRIGYALPLKAKLWGIRRGLKLAKDRNWKGVIIESDSEDALDLIECGEIENHPDRIIIEDCCKMVKELEAVMKHALREGNMCADLLAKMGINQGENDVRVITPSAEIVKVLTEN
ncbi:hypothetical protein LguiA_010522 [Lonicera macranthoides]